MHTKADNEQMWVPTKQEKNKMPRKILTVIGIRPDIIRLSLIIKELDKYFEQVILDTGQHWDYNLNKVMYEELDVPEPHYRLDGKADTQIQQMGKISAQFERVLKTEKPEFVVILGDNNSSLCTALVCANLNIPIAHIESGGRSHNWKMPEEKNRTVIDNLSSILFCYTEEHKKNLLAQGIDPRRAWVVGNPIIDVYNVNRARAEWSNGVPREPEIIKELGLTINPYGPKKDKYILVTCHRAENTQNIEVLDGILSQLSELRKELNSRVILIEMPKLANMMKGREYPYGIEVIPPQSYLDFLLLQMNASLVVTDSGTVPEDSYAMGVPCIQIREKTERVELIENGSTILVDSKGDIVTAAKCLLEQRIYHQSWETIKDPSPYKTAVAPKVARILLSNWTPK